jgi:HEXXH motif-containing protein
LAAEIAEIVRWIMLVKGEIRPEYQGEAYSFGSSSALRAWGAITLNAETTASAFNRAITIVHEAAHDVLFALAPKEGVVTNPDSERYGSPLRADPRPLEGIYHATFVLARIDLAARTMLESGRLNDEQEILARRLLENADLFYDGLATLERHADFTEIGRSALASAENYMRRYAA